MPVAIACRCGQRFLAQDHLFGQQVSCPACGGPLVIPRPEPELLPLAPLAPAPSPLRSSGAYPAGKPGGGPLQLVWLAGIGGAGLLLLVVLVVIVVLGTGSKREPVAQNDNSLVKSSPPPPVVAPAAADVAFFQNGFDSPAPSQELSNCQIG